MNKNKGQWSLAIKSIERVIALMPSREEIDANVAAIDSLISFLQQTRKLMLEQPTRETRQDVLNAITLLSSFLSSHNAKLLFTNKETHKKTTLKSDSAANTIFQELDALSLDEIQSRLLNESLFSAGDLRTLAKYLRIGVDRNFRREDIADTIFKRGFANPRGYKAIGGKAAQRIQEEENKNN